MMRRFLQICFVFLALFTFCNADTVPYVLDLKNFILPKGIHLLAAKGIDGSVIELQDGAQFKVIEEDREIVLEWQINSLLTISASPYWFSDIDFLITHRLTGTSVGVKYQMHPFLDHDFTNRIFHVDPYYGEIILTDGCGHKTSWIVDPQDIQYIKDWKENQTVIIGVYNNWYSKLLSNANFILINYEYFHIAKFIRATQAPFENLP